MKKCSYCGLEKDESEFFKKRKTTLEGFCKKCKRKKVLERESLNPEKYKEKERLRSEQRRETEEWKEWRRNNKDKLKIYTATAMKKFPFKAAARSYVCAAIKEGILIRPDKCSICVKECKPEAHHEDYMRPLDVIWVCRSCHGGIHRKSR